MKVTISIDEFMREYQAQLMIAMACSGKMTLADIEKCMEIDDENERSAVYEVFEKRLNDNEFAQRQLAAADHLQHLKEMYNAGHVVTREMIGLEDNEQADNVMSLLRHVQVY